ncbi:MAG: ATP-binding protein [Desulfobacterales bacterium]|nr:MAG: ATP-binding protein [Desulfobacterales bacterium]
MIISVASGKGGTGKTTVSTNLALSVGSKVQLLDGDVEQPNAHLFMHPVFERTETITTPVPEINLDKCTFCGKCSEICRYNAIVVVGEMVLPFEELCHSCGGCMEVCPENAITEKGRELGMIQTGRHDGIGFIHGKLRVGEAMSPPLIKKVLSFVDPAQINIVDAPPGTSCPVIETMKKADSILLVTEPTPFGLHDLKLAVGAARILNIPCGLVINRSDLGDHQVEAYATAENLPVLMEIPYDRRVAEAYSRGEMIVEVMPEWKLKFSELYQKIRRLVGEC